MRGLRAADHTKTILTLWNSELYFSGGEDRVFDDVTVPGDHSARRVLVYAKTAGNIRSVGCGADCFWMRSQYAVKPLRLRSALRSTGLSAGVRLCTASGLRRITQWAACWSNFG